MPESPSSPALPSRSGTSSKKNYGRSRNKSSGKGRERRKRSGSASALSDRDRNTKQRAKQSSNDDKSLLSPGAHSLSGTGKSQKSEGKDRERKERAKGGTSSSSSDRDRNAKTTAKPSKSDRPSTPGAHYATKDSGRSRKSGGKGRERKERPNGGTSSSSDRDRNAKTTAKPSKSDGPSTPGAHHAAKDSERSRKTSKFDGRERNAKPKSGTSLSDRDRNAKSRAKRNLKDASSAPGAHVSSGSTPEEREARKARRHEGGHQTSADATADVPDAYQVDEAELSNDDQRNDRSQSHKRNQVQSSADAVTLPQESDENQDELSDDRPKRRRWGIIGAVLLLVVGGSLAAFFLTRPSEPTLLVDEGALVPSDSPTFIDLYEPPDQEFCVAVSKNQTSSEERVGLDKFDFGLTMDVTLDVEDDISESQVYTLASQVQQKLVPRLLECADDSIRRTLEVGKASMIRGVPTQRQLGLGSNRYIFADAFVKAEQIQDECTETRFPQRCHRVFMELTVFLKGQIQLSSIELLISEQVEEQLKEEGVGDGNLKLPLRLESPFFDVQLAIVAFLPTSVSQPTAMPANEPEPSAAPSLPPSKSPSKSPTFYPTVAPVSGPSPPPSARPTVVASMTPSMKPSVVPSLAPSLAPVAGPAPPPSTAPSGLPSGSPSLGPTVAASEAPSTNPSPTPSMLPSMNPSIEPSMNPSIRPSMNPSSIPSVSMNPSSVPSKNPTGEPSMNPSSVPSSIPSAGPTQSMVPSGAPTCNPRCEKVRAVLAGIAPWNEQAITWLIETDTWEPDNGDPESDYLWMERYVMADVYYGTNAQNWYFVGDNWLSSEPACSWLPIQQCPGPIKQFWLDENDLTSSIPASIGYLSQLTSLNLGSNLLTSTIPSSIGNLSLLTMMLLGDNRLTGTVPVLPSSLTACYIGYNCLQDTSNGVAAGCGVPTQDRCT